MLQLNDLQKSFGRETPIISGVCLSLSPARAICIAGKNASGKTTILKLACGMLSPDKGTVSCDGRIAFVPQEPAILPELSVFDNLALWYSAQNLSGPDFLSGSPEERLGLTPYRKKRAGTLSGGIKKRLSIAAALVKRPDYLLLDEPFASLDALSCKELSNLLCELKSNGSGILFTSHEPEQISAVADDLALLHEGSLSGMLSLEDIPKEQRPAHILSLLFGVTP